MSKIFKLFYYLIIVLISVIALALIISILPIPGNIKILSVLSGSMEQTIQTGSVVIIKPVVQYRIGDIITFRQGQKNQTPTTHRIYDIRLQTGQPIYITKGDANNAPDIKEISPSDILGQVMFSVPLAGYIIDFAKKPIGFMLIIIIPAAVIIYDEVKKIYEEIRKKKKAKNLF